MSAPESSTPAAEPADRITVSLLPRSRGELETLQGSTGLSRTDVVNRAISAYYYLHRRGQSGEEILVRSADGKKEQLIKFL